MARGRVEPSRVREGPAIEEELVRRAELASSVVIRERTACSANIWRSITPLTSVRQQEGIELGPHGSWRDFHRAKTLRTRREGARWTWLYLRLQTANQTQGPRIVEPTLQDILLDPPSKNSDPSTAVVSASTRALWVGAHDRESNTRGLNMEPRATSRTSPLATHARLRRIKIQGAEYIRKPRIIYQVNSLTCLANSQLSKPPATARPAADKPFVAGSHTPFSQDLIKCSDEKQEPWHLNSPLTGELTDLFGELTAEQTARHSSRQTIRGGVVTYPFLGSYLTN
ncbi:hypothetical protein B0H13DRAFT_1914064 [Mycena leptocephala]|nr:hypothetical protein B0H13DRAFT_1914064 [Mycena leptocephala]